MKKQQTFVTKLLDSNNKMIDFERWSEKRISTIERKLKELYTKYHYTFKRDIEKSTYIVIYEASNNENQIEVKRMLTSDFLA